MTQNKQFKYNLKSGGEPRTLSFAIPYENGSVVTNRYCPQQLLTGGLSHIIDAVNGESISEFDQDCRNQIRGIESAGNLVTARAEPPSSLERYAERSRDYSNLVTARAEPPSSLERYAERSRDYSNVSKIDAHIAGLMAAVMNHINCCGRLIFGDLLIYVDVFSYLLAADGYSEKDVKTIYPRILRGIVDLYPGYVKNSFDLSPIKGSALDNILVSLTK